MGGGSLYDLTPVLRVALLGIAVASGPLPWVCLQGAFGALTVTMKLFPAIVTMHLLGGLVLLALLAMQAVAYRQAQRGGGAHAVPASVRHWLVGACALLWLQVALGGWVS